MTGVSHRGDPLPPAGGGEGGEAGGGGRGGGGRQGCRRSRRSGRRGGGCRGGGEEECGGGGSDPGHPRGPALQGRASQALAKHLSPPSACGGACPFLGAKAPSRRASGKDFLKQAHDLDLGLDLAAIRACLRPDGQGLADPSHAFPHIRRGGRYVEFEHTAEAAQRAGRTFLTVADYMTQNPENAGKEAGAGAQMMAIG